MNFAEAIRSGFSKYAVFSGRASRAEFWWFFFFQALVGTVARVFDRVLFPRGFQPLTGVVFLVVILPLLAVSARRLHDVDRRGWWMLLPVPFLLAGESVAIVGLFSGATPGIVIGGALMAIGFAATILLIVWYCTRGTTGPNRFGSDPLAGTPAQTASQTA